MINIKIIIVVVKLVAGKDNSSIAIWSESIGKNGAIRTRRNTKPNRYMLIFVSILIILLTLDILAICGSL
jgi:hypothetical protein